MDRKKALTFHCSVEATIAVLGGKYKAIIIWHLNVNKIMRYNEIQKAIPQATAKMLSQQLKELETAGADMQLCGHTHDGQMFPGNLTVKLMWENACGYLKKGNLHSIVTSGVGVWGPAMRVGTDCEICPITIHFQG